MYEENDSEKQSFNQNTTMPLGSEPNEPFSPSTNFPNTGHLTSSLLAEGHSSINLNENDGGGYLHRELPTSKSWSMTPQDQIQGEDQQLDHLHRNLLDLSILQNCSNFSLASSFPFLSQGNVLSSSSSSSLGCSAGINLHTSLDTHHILDPIPCDPSLLPMNHPAQQDPSLLLRDLAFHLPMSDHHYILNHGCGPDQQGVSASSGINTSLVFGDNSGSIGMMGMMMEEDHGGDRIGTPSQDGGDVFEFGCSGRGRKESLKFRKSYVTEKERRITMKEMFNHLRTLIPNPSKDDRASIVADAIDYIKELNRSVKELKILKERKRCLRQQKLKRFKANREGNNLTDDNYIPNGGEANVDRLKDEVKSEELDHELFAENGSALRSSWLQRKFRDTEVDVRIVDDEVTIKLVQRKKIVNCLLCVSRALDELQLDLHHVAGGHVGDYCSFLFNSKISEGSSIYASAIANKLIEVVDKQYSSIPSTSSFLL